MNTDTEQYMLNMFLPSVAVCSSLVLFSASCFSASSAACSKKKLYFNPPVSSQTGFKHEQSSAVTESRCPSCSFFLLYIMSFSAFILKFSHLFLLQITLLPAFMSLQPVWLSADCFHLLLSIVFCVCVYVCVSSRPFPMFSHCLQSFSLIFLGLLVCWFWVCVFQWICEFVYLFWWLVGDCLWGMKMQNREKFLH